MRPSLTLSPERANPREAPLKPRLVPHSPTVYFGFSYLDETAAVKEHLPGMLWIYKADMENLGLVNPEQEVPRADPDSKNTHNSLDHNKSNNSPLFNPDVVSSFLDKADSSAVTEEVSMLTSFMQVAQRNSNPKILKNCEHIQNEIRRLGTLQTKKTCSCPKLASSLRLSDSCLVLGGQMGLKADASEEHELFTSQFHPSHADDQADASVMRQEGLTKSVSVSSGYGTLSTAEMSPGKCDDLQACMENSETMTKRQNCPAPALEDAVVGSIQDKRECLQTATGHSPPLKGNDGDFPTQLEHPIHEGHPEEASCKSLTSWAQKMKQNQVKKTTVEEETPPGTEQTIDRTNDLAAAAAVPSTTPFYLNQQSGSQNSLVSLSSGLTYWKLDEKEMYRALPKNLGNEFLTFSTKASSEQLSSGDELKPISLKDIYHKKQKEDKPLVEWNFTPLHSTHPPEILTLDPTLHMKPGELNTERRLPRFYASPEQAPLSPDSMADPVAFSLPSEVDSFSHTSTVVSPRSTESPRYASCSAALHADSWGSCEFQNTADVTGSHHPNDEILDMEDENLTLTPSSVARHPIPSAENPLTQHELSLACVEDPLVLSKIRQNLREKHIRHIADLRAYYESEILSLKQQLEASHTSPSEEMKKINQNLTDRCDRLEAALHEANSRVRSLENKNKALEMEVERIEQMRTSSKDKDNTISRLKRRLKDLEEAFEKAYKLSDNKDARLKEENKMFQNLLGEYESLGKEHERVKDSLNITENKLLDAHTQISDLKRTVSKLETQVKQLEHENSLKFRSLAEGHFGPSYARRHSPPEKDPSPNGLFTNEAIQKEIKTQEIPILKAFKEFEERKALKNRGAQAEKEEEATAETNRLQPSCPENRKGSKSSSYPQPLRSRANRDSSRESYEEGRSATSSESGLSSAPPVPYEPEFKYVSRIRTLAETERLFDELTQEKQQIESQLSRIPCAGGRMTLQARLNQEALEDRLERINRELGSIRMTLKRFQILRTSANI
ncbi:hypothetical protein Chor_012962 [Crotalus horridus]